MKRFGFTLIGLAIAITIMGIILAGVSRIMKIQKENEFAQLAKTNLLISKKAIIENTLINNNTLPDGDFFKNNLSPIKQNEHQLLYVYADGLTSTNICKEASTNLKVDTPNGTINDVAFIVVSEGANRNMQTAYDDTNKKVTLHARDEKVDDNTSDKDIDELYDDIAQWVTINELRRSINCSQEKLKITNASALPSDVDSSNNYLGSKNAAIYASGGFAYDDGSDSDTQDDYDWCIENAPSWLNNNSCGGSSLKDCSSGYSRCSVPTLDGDPPAITDGSSSKKYTFRMYVKDSKGNIATKYMSITIEKDTSSWWPGGGKGNGNGNGGNGNGNGYGGSNGNGYGNGYGGYGNGNGFGNGN